MLPPQAAIDNNWRNIEIVLWKKKQFLHSISAEKKWGAMHRAPDILEPQNVMYNEEL